MVSLSLSCSDHLFALLCLADFVSDVFEKVLGLYVLQVFPNTLIYLG